ncbi:MAG: hypothetical protein JO154_11845 [Chitinophaga sp.]|uniref:hypothetical protein n=1 Tax=Chitinophaga sp. TaxID=1869181 RepID=UPI0025BF061C|nr:hypothetical protein [Chitinophaga sp.]MBV8253291.1 hypothetical protein [Chitinophaga sp.]
MENKSVNKKVIFSGSLVAGAILGLATLANANPVSYTNMGSGTSVRSTLTGNGHVMTTEMKCSGKDSAKMKHEGKCTPGKCSPGKCAGAPKKGKGGKAKGMAKPAKDTTKGGM